MYTCVQKILFITDDFRFLSHSKFIIPCSYRAPLSHLTSCTPTKSNLHLANSLTTAVSETALHRLFTIEVPNLMSPFHCLGRTKVSVQVLGTCLWFVTKPVLWRGIVNTSPNLQAGGPPLVGCPRLLIQYIRRYLAYWRPFLHPQPEDAPGCGDRYPTYHGIPSVPVSKWMTCWNLKAGSYFSKVSNLNEAPNFKL